VKRFEILSLKTVHQKEAGSGARDEEE